ncbi:MAG: hemerythrin domain-containing protein, partial [Actinomycetota bacterium]|nr:hemerythrin domain-containing protein [Actinomycetota bacterium]
MRPLTEQTVEELGGEASVLVLQRRDHAELQRRLARVRAAEGVEQDAALASLYRLVFPHAFAEESVIWPAVRQAVPDGEALTLRNEQEHQQVNELVERLEGLRPDDRERAALVEQVCAVLDQDVRDEEDLILPRLQDAVDVATLRRLGRSWSFVRRTAPTRPHPVVSRRPPGNALAALPLTVLDRSRDLLDAQARRLPLRWA